MEDSDVVGCNRRVDPKFCFERSTNLFIGLLNLHGCRWDSTRVLAYRTVLLNYWTVVKTGGSDVIATGPAWRTESPLPPTLSCCVNGGMALSSVALLD